jgi:hypothetical protein
MALAERNQHVQNVEKALYIKKEHNFNTPTKRKWNFSSRELSISLNM